MIVPEYGRLGRYRSDGTLSYWEPCPPIEAILVDREGIWNL
jgi:hypothetical protein